MSYFPFDTQCCSAMPHDIAESSPSPKRVRSSGSKPKSQKQLEDVEPIVRRRDLRGRRCPPSGSAEHPPHAPYEASRHSPMASPPRPSSEHHASTGARRRRRIAAGRTGTAVCSRIERRQIVMPADRGIRTTVEQRRDQRGLSSRAARCSGARRRSHGAYAPARDSRGALPLPGQRLWRGSHERGRRRRRSRIPLRASRRFCSSSSIIRTIAS